MPPSLLMYFLFVAITAYLFAKLEIQIEGKFGWAEKLPTWRKELKWFKFLPAGNKPLTGYHFYLWLTLFSLFHYPLVYLQWNIQLELIILSSYMLTLWMEDFLWFVLNPDYGLKKFNKQDIPWHTKWIWKFPRQYYIYFIIWLTLFTAAIKS